MNATAVRRTLDGLLLGIVRNMDPKLAVVTGSALPAADRIYWTRVMEGGTISKARFNVQTTVAGNMCIAFARNTGTGLNAAPGTRIATTGSFTIPGTGDVDQALDVTVTVRPGDWVGVAATSATLALLCATGAGNVSSSLFAGTAYREQFASGSPVIPSARNTLFAHIGKPAAIVGVP